MTPKIGITEKDLDKSIELLSVILSDEMTLYIKTRKFHWNVCGESFMELHKLFEQQYKDLEEIIDLVAERISKLGGKNYWHNEGVYQTLKVKRNARKISNAKRNVERIVERLRNNYYSDKKRC